FQPNEIIFHFEGKLGGDNETNGESLQMEEELFLESTITFDDYLNHSCDPNCFIDFENLNLVAKKCILQGEELTYNYNTSEYDLIQVTPNSSFHCTCCSKNCIQFVRGFRYLPPHSKKDLESFLSPFLKKKLKEETTYFK
ncbi:SET domain-containing protein-lysine N-methyltransferase, partial [Candidatus Woesearchaeota archaeon]|nr:SET domain-containing protein-lysine N-methyltransferase [Candidatus Woesearchaeota archaeon]